MSLAAPYRAGVEAEPRQLVHVSRLSAEQLSEIRHALQNPLAAITGFAELLHTRRDEETHREAPARILEAASQLSLALEDLLTLIALESGTLVLDTRTVDLGAIAAQVLTALETRTGRRQSADCRQQAWPRVEGDPERLAQVLRHVIEYAFAHGSGRGSLEVTAERAGAFAIVSIAFVTPAESPPRSPVEAGGLGFAIAQGLIALHGGSLWTGGEAGRHSTFAFTVPLAESEKLA